LDCFEFNAFKDLKRFVTVSLFGLNRSCGKVSQGGKFEIKELGKYEFNSALNSSALRVEVVISSKGLSSAATAANRE
jgi:hypothetical protein